MTRKAVMEQIRIILQGLKENHSYRTIGREANVSHGSVQNVNNRVVEIGIDIDALLAMGDEKLHTIIYPTSPKQRWMPDWESIYQQKKTVRRATLLQLYNRYLKAVPEQTLAYSYASFCRLFDQWSHKNGHVAPVANVPHEPGQKMEIDYSGDTFEWIDAKGVRQTAHIFVAVWPYSSLVFAYATKDEKQQSWLEGCVHALEYAKGAAELLIVDNAKALVKHADQYEGTVQLALQDLCEHYGMRAHACRPRHPKEKNRVEAGVCDVQRWILADFKLDGRCHFNTIEELNTALRESCDRVNERKFTDGSQDCRRSLFEREEAPVLKPLPSTRYESIEWRILIGDKGHCVRISSDGGHRYSVPGEYVDKRVIVRLSDKEVRLFDSTTFKPIGTHERHYETSGKKTHLLPQHLTEVEKCIRRNEDDFIDAFVSAAIPKNIACVYVHNAFSENSLVARKHCNAILSLRKKTKQNILAKCLEIAIEVENTELSFIRHLVEQEEALDKRQGELELCGGDPNYVTVEHENIRSNFK